MDETTPRYLGTPITAIKLELIFNIKTTDATQNEQYPSIAGFTETYDAAGTASTVKIRVIALFAAQPTRALFVFG